MSLFLAAAAAAAASTFFLFAVAFLLSAAALFFSANAFSPAGVRAFEILAGAAVDFRCLAGAAGLAK